MIRRSIVGMLALAITLAACAQARADAPPAESVAAQVAATLAALTPAAQAPAEVTPGEAPAESPPVEPTAAPAGPPIVRIAYISGGNIWLAEGDTPPAQLTTSGSAESVRLSSDGQRIAFTRRPAADGPAELRAVNRDATGEMLLAAADTWTSLHPTGGLLFNDLNQFDFIPGTHHLLLNTRGVPEGPGLMRFNDLLRLDADSGELTTLRAPEAGGDFLVSPDGLKMAIIQHERISLAAIDGTPIRTDAITFPSVITYSEYLYHPAGQWTPDSSAVGFAIPSSDPLAADASATIWRLPADGSPAVSLATIPGDFFFTQFDSTSLSPNLAWVAFQRNTTSPNVRNLILARTDGSVETVVATGQMSWYGWAPDSTRYAFSLDDPKNLQLGVVGVSPTPLANGIQLQWADASTCVYASGSTGAWTLMRWAIGEPTVAIASPAAEFVEFDLVER